jgi:hypothetical protein
MVPTTKSGHDASFSIFGGWHLFPLFPVRKVPARGEMDPLNQRLETGPEASVYGHFNGFYQLFDTFWAGCEKRALVLKPPCVASQKPRP